MKKHVKPEVQKTSEDLNGRPVSTWRNDVIFEAKEAFENAEPYEKGDTVIKVLPNVTVYVLNGHEIAYLYNDPDRTLSITTHHTNRRAYRIRLNSLKNVNVMLSNGKYYLNGIHWNGELTDVYEGCKKVDDIDRVIVVAYHRHSELIHKVYNVFDEIPRRINHDNLQYVRTGDVVVMSRKEAVEL